MDQPLFGEHPDDSVILEDEQYGALMEAFDRADITSQETIINVVQSFERAVLATRLLALLVDDKIKIVSLDKDGTPKFGLVTEPDEDEPEDPYNLFGKN